MPVVRRLHPSSWFVVCVVVSLLAGPVFAQAPSSVTGRVIDAYTMRPIADAVVSAGESRATTNRDGQFTLSVPRGRVRVAVSAPGFLPDQVEVTVGDQPVTVEVLLLDEAQFREEVVVTAGMTPAVPSPSTLDVSPLEVRSVAGAGENVFRTLQTLPGVSATEDFGSRLSVRGGGPDQNLTVMDGVEIHNPYRLFGLTSAFNPETVENFELLTGGFSAKYGDRLSSILIIENRPGTMQESFAGSSSLSLTDANTVVEGRLPKAMNGSWLVTARRTYYDLVANRITGEDLPTFADLQTRLVWDLGPGRRFAISGIRSRERTDAQFDSSSSDSSIGFGNRSANDLLSASYSSILGSSASMKTTAAWYDYRDSLDAAGDLRDDTVRSNAPGDDAFGRVNLALNRTLGVRDASLRQEFAAHRGRHHLELGADAHALETRVAWDIAGDRNVNQANGSSVQGGTALPSQLDSRRRSWRGGAWLLDRVEVSKSLSVEPGLRVDWNNFNGETVVSPRVAAVVTPGGGFTVRAAAGLFTQSPGNEKLLQSDYFVDLTATGRSSLRSERSIHALLSVERTFASGLVARVEGYYKSFDRMIVGRLETPAETAARVALYDFPQDLASSVPTAPQVTSQPINGANGSAYGVDMYLALRPTHASQRLSGWASYTLGKATLENYGRTYPFDYDRRHALSVVGSYRVSSWFDVAATVRVASGFPYTPAQGLRVAAQAVYDTAGVATRYVPDRDANGLLRWTVDPGGAATLNSGTLPVFARVDLRATFRPGWSNRRWQFYAEVINALNRDNAGALSAVLDYNPSGTQPTLTFERRGGFPLLPSIGVRLRF
jgi:outer membrane receptor for ferrienterochelin and colicin